MSDMKEISLSVPMDFSEAAIEDAIRLMRNEHHKEFMMLKLYVSVFDVNGAVSMLIDDKYFQSILNVNITPHFRSGEWKLEDTVNDVYITSCS